MTPPAVGRPLAWTYLFSFVAVAVQTVHIAITARIISPADFAAFALAMTLIQLATYFVTTGLVTTIVRSDGDCDDILKTILTIAAAIGLVVGGAAILTGQALHRYIHLNLEVMEVLAIQPLLLGIGACLVGLLRRHHRFITAAAAESASLVTGLAASAALVIGGLGVRGLALGQVLYGLTLVFLAAIASHRMPRFGWNRWAAREALSYAQHIGPQNICHFVLFNWPLWFVAHVASPLTTGLFARSWNLVSLPANQLAVGASKTIAASYARGSVEGSTDVNRRLPRILRIAGLAGGALFGLGAGTADPMLTVLLGNDWSGAIPFLRLISLSAALNLVYTLLASSAESTRRMRLLWIGILIFAASMAAGTATIWRTDSPAITIIWILIVAQIAALCAHGIGLARLFGRPLAISVLANTVLTMASWLCVYQLAVRLVSRCETHQIAAVLTIYGSVLTIGFVIYSWRRLNRAPVLGRTVEL